MEAVPSALIIAIVAIACIIVAFLNVLLEIQKYSNQVPGAAPKDRPRREAEFIFRLRQLGVIGDPFREAYRLAGEGKLNWEKRETEASLRYVAEFLAPEITISVFKASFGFGKGGLGAETEHFAAYFEWAVFFEDRQGKPEQFGIDYLEKPGDPDSGVGDPFARTFYELVEEKQ